MELKHYILIAIGLLIAFRIIKAIMYPPKPITWAEVPEPLRTAFEASVPGFEVKQVKYFKEARKYKMLGNYRGDPVTGEVEHNSAGEAVEIECESTGPGVRTLNAPCELGDLPAEVITHMGELLGDEREHFEATRVHKGAEGDDQGFKIKGRTPTWRWEFELSASGRLIELEKERVTG